MRDYKFRGKRVDNGEWVTGFYVYDEEWAKAYIYNGSGHDGIYHGLKRFEVDPKTVGQFTGLKDKNVREIYEGDLLSNGIHHPGEVIFRDACFYVGPFRCELYKFAGSQKEVIGNIYENPELLGGDK